MPHAHTFATLLIGISQAVTSLGTTSDYRSALRVLSPLALFSSSDVDYSCSNIDGPVAVAGNLQMARMGLNGQGKLSDMAVQVGRHLLFRDGSIRGSAAAVLGATVSHFDAQNILSGGYTDCSAGAYVNCLSFYSLNSIATRLAEYRSAMELASKELANQPSPLTQLSSGGELNLTAQRGFNFFSITGSQLSRVRRVRIAGGSDSRVVLNVQDGGPTSLANLGNDFIVQGMPEGSVLLNFPQAKAVAIKGSILPAVVLAPAAEVSFSEGRIDGALFAGGTVSASPTQVDFGTESFNCTASGGQLRWVPFTLP